MPVSKLVNLIYSYAADIRNGRSLDDVMRHADSELVELQDEIAKVTEGQAEGDDGVVGEAVDIIACVVDLLHEAGCSAKDAIAEIEASPATESDASVSFFAQVVATELDLLNKAVRARYMIPPRSGTLVRTLLELIQAHRPGTTMAEIEAIALAKCEKWKRYYSKSVDRVR